MITCLHCPMQLKEHVGPVIVGQTEDQKLADLITRLGTHLRMAHPQHFGEVAMLSGNMAGLAVLCQFETPDESVKTARTRSSALINGCVRRVLTDEDIERIVKASPMKEIGRFQHTFLPIEEACSLLRQMRDWLNYSDVPGVPQPKNPETVGRAI